MIFQNKTLILASTLAFLVCSSKNLIIYNEEILVALSFLCFVFFSFSSFQESVKETFESRQAIIQQELEQMALLKRENVEKLKKAYEQSFALVQSLEALKLASMKELSAAQNQRVEAFEACIQRKSIQKLNQILTLEKQFTLSLHTKITQSFTQSILNYFYKNKSSLIPQLFDQACAQLKK